MPSQEIQRAWAALQRGDAAAAAREFEAVVTRFPASAEAHAGLGHVLLRLGDVERATASLERARALQPRYAPAWRDLALIAMRRADLAGAEAGAQQAVALAPHDANAWFLLAQAHFALNRHEAAEAAFARAAALHPSFIQARFALANAAYDRQAFAAAARHYRAFVSARPDDLNGWINLGLSLASGGDFVAAREALERAVALAPDQVKPVALLASVLGRSGAPAAEQLPVLGRVLELSPALLDVRLQLACCRFDLADYAGAHAELRRVLERQPDHLAARWLQLQMPDSVVAPDSASREAWLERWRAGIARFEAIDWRDPALAPAAAEALTSATAFYLAYLGEALVDEQRRNAAVLQGMARAALPQVADLPPRPIGRRPRRIAVFSASLHAHSVSRVWSSALLALDPAEFELHAFHPGSRDDASTRRWRERAQRFESGTRMPAEWIDALRASAADLVVFPDIGLDRIVQAVAAFRHAPVQVAGWGHPVTTGLSSIDYFLSADAFEPVDADRHYSERLVRLPRLGSYLELPEPVARRTDARDDRDIRLICTQSADKLHPGHDALFADVLEAIPHSRLEVLCSDRAPAVAAALAARLQGALAARGIDGARVVVHSRLPVDDYYRRIEGADVALDSLDFSGCVTSLDALWRDLPIVTLPGALMRGRQTAGMLALLGLDELIATDRTGYVRIVARLAGEPAWRESIRQRIAAGKASLYRDESVVAALAEFLRSVEAPVGADA